MRRDLVVSVMIIETLGLFGGVMAGMMKLAIVTLRAMKFIGFPGNQIDWVCTPIMLLAFVFPVLTMFFVTPRVADWLAKYDK